VDLYMVVLRILHIVMGAFWVGAAIAIFAFVQPAAREVGPAAAPLMMNLAQKRRLPDVVLAAAAVTVLAGLLMYWRVTDGLDPDLIGTGYGISITLGAIAAIVAVALGASIVRPSMLEAAGIAREVAASGEPPSPEQAARIQALQAKVRSTGTAIVPLLVFAAAAMAAARYL
jgi:putative copper export protein